MSIRNWSRYNRREVGLKLQLALELHLIEIEILRDANAADQCAAPHRPGAMAWAASGCCHRK